MTPDRDDRSDEELLGLAGHDPTAFEELYRRCVGKTLVFALRRCETPEQVHDLVAATWLEVIELELVAFGSLRQEEAASALGIAPAAFRMRLARARRKLRAATDIGPDLEVIER